MISDGWNWSGSCAEPPARAVDLDAEAGDLHEQQHTNAAIEQRGRHAADVHRAQAREHVHRDEPEAP